MDTESGLIAVAESSVVITDVAVSKKESLVVVTAVVPLPVLEIHLNP
jgi:hypothetical protein